MHFATVYPCLRSAYSNLFIDCICCISEIITILFASISCYGCFCHTICVRIAFTIILRQIIIGIGVAIPHWCCIHCFCYRTCFCAGSCQCQYDFIDVVMHFATVYPCLCSAYSYIFWIMNGVGNGNTSWLINTSLIGIGTICCIISIYRFFHD